MIRYAHANHNIGKTKRKHTQQTGICTRQTYYLTEYSAQKDETIKCTKYQQKRHDHRRKIVTCKHDKPLINLVGQVHEEG